MIFCVKFGVWRSAFGVRRSAFGNYCSQVTTHQDINRSLMFVEGAN